MPRYIEPAEFKGAIRSVFFVDGPRNKKRTFSVNIRRSVYEDPTFELDIPERKETYLLLHNAGLNTIPQELLDKIFGTDPFTLAINLKSGEVLIAQYLQVKRGTIRLELETFGLRWGAMLNLQVPNEFLPILSQKIEKRFAYDLAFEELAMLDYMMRETGFRDLAQSLVLRLNLSNDDFSLIEIKAVKEGHPTFYRTSSIWHM